MNVNIAQCHRLSTIFHDLLLTYLKQKHICTWNNRLLNLFREVKRSTKITIERLQKICGVFLAAQTHSAFMFTFLYLNKVKRQTMLDNMSNNVQEYMFKVKLQGSKVTGFCVSRVYFFDCLWLKGNSNKKFNCLI